MPAPASPQPLPRIFVSHSHHDNAFCRPFVAHLRTALGLTDPDHIFYDESSLHTGDTWLRRLQQEVLARPIFIVILTPRSVAADYVQMETELALAETISHHERRMCSVLVEPCDINQLAPALRRYQLVDMVQKSYDAAFADLVAGLRAPAGTPAGASSAAGMSATRPASAPPTRIVDPLHHGDHASIGEAIRAARPGDHILVHRGLYREALVLDKPLELVGDGAAAEVVIEVTGTNVIRCVTTYASVSNLTLRQLGGGNGYGVDIAQGRLQLEGCDISSQSLAAIGIHGGAFGELRRNHIHDGKQDGVSIFESGQGLLEDNEIYANACAGVNIGSGGNPTLRRNRISKNAYQAIWLHDRGGGIFEANDLRGNTRGAWLIAKDCVARVTRKDNQE